MEISTFVVYIFVIFGFLVLPFILLKTIKNLKKQKIAIVSIFIFYILVLLVGVWGKLDISLKTTKLTFDFSQPWCAKSINWKFSHLSTFDIITNLVMLIPIGTFIVYFCHKKWKLLPLCIFLIFIGLFCGFFIELSQFILPIPRSVQLSDIIFNSISVLIGGLLGLLLIQLTKPDNKDQNLSQQYRSRNF